MRTGLILSGGGARAAYQVGVLAAIAELLPVGASNPSPVIVGTSAGAINAVSLASGTSDFSATIQRLTAFWQGFRACGCGGAGPGTGRGAGDCPQPAHR